MTLLTPVKNSDSGFKKASKNIQVRNMKIISLKEQSWAAYTFNGVKDVFFAINRVHFIINLSPELIEGSGSWKHGASVSEASLIIQPQLVAIPGLEQHEYVICGQREIHVSK